MTNYTTPSVVRRDGNRWILSNGRTLPVISGGAGEDDPQPSKDDSTAVPGIVVDVPVKGDPAPAPDQRLFTEEELNAARSAEKDKLYKELETHKTRAEQLAEQMKEFEEFKAAQEAEREAAAQREIEEQRAREQEELSAKELLVRREQEWEQRLNEAQQTWEEKFAAVEEERKAAAALLEREREFQALESYKARRLQEEAEHIMPELLDLVVGVDEESIESAIAAAKDKTYAIMESVTRGQQLARGPRGVPATGASPEGPTENHLSKQNLTAADIAAMSPEEYKAMRHQLIPQARF